MKPTTAEARERLVADDYRKCPQCQLIAPVGRHGMVDCVAELQRQIRNLRRERNEAQIELRLAKDDLAELKTTFRRVFDE